ncbi:hypothetical protein ZYGR_0H01770 [Zygosaccharomyces rouxii]|uniref:Autophagy-related protein 33 n=2 Tax=Zygosaccharomyces rouxii TaxID=4956 RepID=ATG33_ZYGRC|nr:uncharacterized protein ZYRO0B08096g [Zygosaccharomyces rouxii]C5DRF7.1 RecName: Full=Autophagy-related protein 33 [Zygosaccharomyces rouxii CBS 732]KAH9200091.1 autophagy-related protein 33 [Zygosaccharomyces rouxii]GAV47336.1 hypothetical protein ZYGR_0H01770 [Zygosaccharomyces rouxii]CAR26368.1 ZYRO0B08096p [Zygosaccharomyces rouxii]
MSVCLGVTKGIAVSSLGIYAGILTTGTICTYMVPVDVITKHLNSVVCRVGEVASALGLLSTGFFSLSYFGAPSHLRHPYLIYSALVAPASALYLWAISRCNHKCHAKSKIAEQGKTNGDNKTQSPPLGDSVVDLGADSKVPSGHPPVKEGAKCPMGNAVVTNEPSSTDYARPAGCQSKFAKHLAVVTGVAIIGFLQSVIGVYGEPA